MSRDLVFFALSLFTWGLGESMFLLFQPLYLQQLGASPFTIGAILGAWGAAIAVTHIPAGHLADRFGQRPLLWAAWLIGLVATLLMALGVTLPIYVTGLLLYGFTMFAVAPMNSYITATRGKWSVGRALTLGSAAFNLGAIVGPWLGGRIADQAGIRTIYWFALGIFLLSTSTIFFLRPQPAEKADPEKDRNRIHFSKPYLLYLAEIFIVILVTTLPQPLSSNFLMNQGGLTFGQIGQLGAISSLGVVIFNLVLGHLNVRLGWILAQFTVGLFAFLLWRGTSLPWYTIGYFLLGGYRVARSLGTAQVRELVSPSVIGLAYGITETVNSVAALLAAPLAGFLYGFHPTWMYSFSFFLILFTILISYLVSPSRQRSGYAPIPADPAEETIQPAE